MKKEEIQKLIREAFELGCEQGRAEYHVSDYCTSEKQENSVWDSIKNQQDAFLNRTGFKLQ